MGFFSALKPVTNFLDVTSEDHYQSIPADWVVVLTDVIGSTKAIEDGRYRDVNVLGASSLMAMLNALDGFDAPYVFGGDGATLLAPSSYIPQITAALKACQRLAVEKFRLKLRAGIVPIEVIRAGGTDIRIAKYEVGPTAAIAKFRGGGCAYADALIKDIGRGEAYRIEVADDEKVEGDFSGLQCRWDPIAAKKGRMVTLLLSARPRENETLENTYREMINEIDSIVGELRSPAQRDVLESQLRKGWLRGGAKEVRVRSFGLSVWQSLRYRFQVLFEMFAFRWMLERKTKGESFDPDRYLSELPKATDFRKFDDTLRMVFECADDRLVKLEAFLETRQREGQIFYGLHKSDQALMTCLVFNYNHHLHLIDGSDGGYTAAAKQYKAQVKKVPGTFSPPAASSRHLEK